jgi:hypothetical protein
MSVGMLDTPPSSDVEGPTHQLPPSPPVSPKRRKRSVVDRLIGTIRLLKAGRPVPTESEVSWCIELGITLLPHLIDAVYKGWQVFKVSPAQYAEFQSRLQLNDALYGYYEDKVRYDWEAETSTYILRMPNSAVHERFIRRV